MRIQILFIFIYLFFSSLSADEPIALVTKSRGNAKYKISSESKFHTNAEVNTPIFDGNGIKTKAKSFAKIVYLDDRSTVSVFPQTEIIIHGTIDKRMINKQVKVTVGILKVMVFSQISSKFKLTTPYSELTCHECEFWVLSDAKKGDRIYKISGDVRATNLSMIETIDLPKGAFITAVLSSSGDLKTLHHSTIIEPDDHVIVFITDRERIADVEGLFEED